MGWIMRRERLVELSKRFIACGSSDKVRVKRSFFFSVLVYNFVMLCRDRKSVV